MRKWVTYHGISLNYAVEMERYQAIVPCGLDPVVEPVGSLGRHLGRAVDLRGELVPARARERVLICLTSVCRFRLLDGVEVDAYAATPRSTIGDGRADNTEIFAEGLVFPTGIEPGDGGGFVGQSTELLHF